MGRCRLQPLHLWEQQQPQVVAVARCSARRGRAPAAWHVSVRGEPHASLVRVGVGVYRVGNPITLSLSLSLSLTLTLTPTLTLTRPLTLTHPNPNPSPNHRRGDGKEGALMPGEG